MGCRAGRALMWRAIRHEFRMFAAERLGDVAVPAHRPVSCERFLQFFEGDFIPLHGLLPLTHERRRMLVPVDFPDRLVAGNARLTRVPAIHDRLNETPIRVALDLGEAILTAIFFLGPARAIT